MKRSWWAQQPVSERSAAWYWTALFACVFFVTVFRTGSPLGLELDNSWSAVLGWAHLNSVQWGEDLVFTFGPLGYLHPRGVYNPALYDTFMVGQLLLALGYTFIYASVFRRLTVMERVVFVLIVLIPARRQHDTLLLGTAIFSLVALDDLIQRSRDSHWAWPGLAVVALLMNALALMKFTLLPLSVLLCGVGLLLLLRERRVGAAAAWAALWLGSLAALWLGHGQSVAGFFHFVTSSLQVTAGYSGAMGVDGSDGWLVAGVVMLLGSAALLLAWWRRESLRDLRMLLLCGYLGFCLFVAWRNAYTRADIWHMMFFFPLAAFTLMASWGLGSWRPQRLIRIVGVVALVLYAVGVPYFLLGSSQSRDFAVAGAEKLQGAATGALRASYEQQYQALRAQWDMPRLRQLIGTERVDVFGCDQSLVLLNDLNYAPRPVFQGYAAYTPALERRNEAYYLGPEAPRFVILSLCPIDLHVAASDDALALLALLRQYRPVAAEKGHVLLQRDANLQAAVLPALEPGRVLQLGEWLDVPESTQPQRLQLNYELSLAGKLRALLLREPQLMLELQLADGQTRHHRLVRQVAGAGFLLSPAVLDEEDYLRWYYGLERLAVKRLRLYAGPEWQHLLFKPGFGVAFAPVEIPAAGTAADAVPADMVEVMYPGFSLLPIARSGLISNQFEDTRPILFMHAAASLDFAPAPGTYSLQTEFGLREQVISKHCRRAGANGIQIRLERFDSTQSHEVFQRTLDPYRKPEEGGPQQQDVASLTLAAGERLRFMVGPGDQGNAACDFGYVSRFVLTPLVAAPAPVP